MKPVASALVFALTALAARAARADDPDVKDLVVLAGTGMALNYRGAAEILQTDLTASMATGRSAVWATRESASMLIAPTISESSEMWAAWMGVKLGGYGFDSRQESVGGVAYSNVEPTFGLIIESPGDRLRFEIDGALALSIQETQQLSTQAALAAAASIAPHDDLLFLPNLRGAGRMRVAVTRRWDNGPSVSSALGAEVETGLANVQGPYGSTSGAAGGGEIFARFYLRRHESWFQGVMVGGSGDVSYTSLWAANVVLPLRLAVTVTVPVTRLVELEVAGAMFGTDVIDAPLPYTSLTAALRVGFGRKAVDWTQRALDVAPDLQTEH